MKTEPKETSISRAPEINNRSKQKRSVCPALKVRPVVAPWNDVEGALLKAAKTDE